MNLPDWIDRFHEAALDPSQWMVVLQELADATGSSRAELVGFGGPGFVSFNWVTSADEGLLQDFLSIGGGSPCANFRLAADDGHSILTVADERAYDRARKHLKRHDYLDFCEQHQMVFGCQTTLVRENNGLVGMSLLRSREDGRTDDAVQAIFASAAAAARTAVRMQRAIELRGHELLSGALEAFPAPCLLLDGFGQIDRAVVSILPFARSAGSSAGRTSAWRSDKAQCRNLSWTCSAFPTATGRCPSLRAPWS